MDDLREPAKHDVAAKAKLMWAVGPSAMMRSHRKRASLKDFYTSMQKLDSVLKSDFLKEIRFRESGRGPMDLSQVRGRFEKVKQAFNRLKKDSCTKNRVKLFDSVEMLRVEFGSDFKVVVDETYHGPTLLLSALMANMRHASLETLSRDPGFKAFAEKARQRASQFMESLRVEPKAVEEMNNRFGNPRQGPIEYSGGGKIVLVKGKPVVRLAVVNKETFYWDNPVLVEPLMQKKCEFYFHSHPGPRVIEFTSLGMKTGRWNVDIETAKALNLPFLLYSGGKVFVYHNKKTKEIKKLQ